MADLDPADHFYDRNTRLGNFFAFSNPWRLRGVITQYVHNTAETQHGKQGIREFVNQSKSFAFSPFHEDLQQNVGEFSGDHFEDHFSTVLLRDLMAIIGVSEVKDRPNHRGVSSASLGQPLACTGSRTI